MGRLEPLLAEHPLRERPHAQMMLALYRAGRQADALATYRRFHDRLDAELGLVPSAELARLHTGDPAPGRGAAVDSTPALAAAVPETRALPRPGRATQRHAGEPGPGICPRGLQYWSAGTRP